MVEIEGSCQPVLVYNIRKVDADVQARGVHKQKQSVFASAQLAWRNSLFLDVTGA